MGIRGGFSVALAALGAVLATNAFAGPVQDRWPNSSRFLDNNYTFGISGVFNNSDTDFHGVGNASDTTGMICADGTANFWNSTLRYAGEFSGFRIAGAGSICQGFGTASEHVGDFDGRTTLGTFMSVGGRLIAPMNFNGFMIMPSVGAGIGFGNVKVEAAPFESNRSWRSGLYWEAGAAMPLSNWGMGVTQGIDASATEIYVNFKRWDAGNQTLDGGARTDTVFNMYVVGARIKF
jgi:hypothetical protein